MKTLSGSKNKLEQRGDIDDVLHLNVLLYVYFKEHSFKYRKHYEQVNIIVMFRIRGKTGRKRLWQCGHTDDVIHLNVLKVLLYLYFITNK